MKDRLALAGYEAVTQVIIWLGRIRQSIARHSCDPRWFPPGRVFRVYWPTDAFECCDCGLTHTQMLSADDVGRGYGGWMYPERPKGYGYRLRLNAGEPDLWLGDSDGGEG